MARANPLSGNPLRTRSDVQQAVRDLVTPLLPHFSPGGARVRLGSFAAHFPMADAEFEGFARPLFGLAPLAAGGGRWDHWELWRRGLAAGVDPDHPEHWTFYENTSQTMVEQAALGLALALVPEELFEPLPDRSRQQLVEWLQRIERFEPVPNNWQFFRILVQCGLARIGAPVDADAQERSLVLLDSFYLGDGWYEDGSGGARDHYVGWALHAYGLIFAALVPEHPLSGAFRTRAREFAGEFEAWFDPHGGVVPFGRSLTYRFAAAGFWSALAFADEEALPWGTVKGLVLRQLRSWSALPISDRDGVLSIGWAYANPWMREGYNSPGSPYWAMKAFLCLTLPESHAFWRAEETELGPRESDQPRPGMRLARDASHAVALSGAHGTEKPFEQSAAKYGRLVYSSRFGPALEGDAWGRARPGDSALVLSEPGAKPRLVRHVRESAVADGLVYCRWSPGDGVLVHTVLGGGAPWHFRLHRIVTDRALRCEETGFAVGDWDALAGGFESGPGWARVVAAEGVSEIRADSAEREGRTIGLPANASLTRPFSAVPALRCDLPAGTHELACVVFASDDPQHPERGRVPEIPAAARAWLAARCAESRP